MKLESSRWTSQAWTYEVVLNGRNKVIIKIEWISRTWVLFFDVWGLLGDASSLEAVEIEDIEIVGITKICVWKIHYEKCDGVSDNGQEANVSDSQVTHIRMKMEKEEQREKAANFL